jgi:hypothetical protein
VNPQSSIRREFLELLSQIERGLWSAADWENLVVTHHADVAIEKARIQLVRGAIAAGEWLPPVVPQSLRQVAATLRKELERIGA